MPSPLRLGTRGSKLALAQADLVNRALAKSGATGEPVIITTSGDWKPEHGEKRLMESAGGKGLFVKEIEQALMEGRIDVGIHSLKDVPSFLPHGLGVDHVLDRGDARDAFIACSDTDLMSLKPRATVGTASLRRQAIVKKLRPDLNVVPLRGNVPTRLDKLRQGQVDAIILANAGLSRLGNDIMPLSDFYCTLLAPEVFLPACGQGIIGIESKTDDTATRAVLDSIHHTPTGLCAAAERRTLQILDGSCHTPIGAYATYAHGRIRLAAMVAAPDGTDIYRAEREGAATTIADAVRMGEDLGAEIRANAPHLLPAACAA